MTGPIDGTFAQENFTAADLQGPMQGKSISDLVRAMQNGETYTNVHTVAFRDGEIRGQISGTIQRLQQLQRIQQLQRQ